MEQEPPTIELAGVRLRPLRPQDAVSWHGYLSDPQVTELTSYPEMSLAAVESMIASRRKSFASGLSCKWAIASQDDDALIGTCGFNEWSRVQGWAELAYELARSHWGRGIATQAVAASLRWAFTDGGFVRVHAFVMVGNVRSERVLERAHFTREGRLRSYRLCRGQPRDFSTFSILRPEWEAFESGTRKEMKPQMNADERGKKG